jgi:hypothetical protein
MGGRCRCGLFNRGGTVSIERDGRRLAETKGKREEERRKRGRRTIRSTVGNAKHIPSVVLEAVHGGVAVIGTTRLAELNHARLEVGERTFDEALLLLVVREEVVPEGVLRRDGPRSISRRKERQRGRRKGGNSERTLLRTFGFPRMTRPYLARVRATLRRLGSFKNPIPWCSLLLTQETMM